MNRIASFYKVSFEQYQKDCKAAGYPLADDEKLLRMEWEDIKLPERATAGSAGYDFFMPLQAIAVGEEPVVIPTGIRCQMDVGWLLGLLPKSGLGFKYGTRLMNTLGIVDEDFFFSDNEGHIHVKLSSEKPCNLLNGQKFVQGIFFPFGITTDDKANGVRNGGFGSTGK